MPYFALSIVSSFFLLLLGISNAETISRGRSSIAAISFILCSSGILLLTLSFIHFNQLLHIEALSYHKSGRHEQVFDVKFLLCCIKF